MGLQLSFRNMKPRDEVRRRIEALYAKLERFLDPAADTHVLVGVEHGFAVVEIVVAARGETYKATEEHDDLRTAIDKLFHKAEEHLRRAKDRRVSRRKSAPPEADGFVAGDETGTAG